MSVEETIYTALRTLVADRVYPDIAPAGTVLPYMTYQQVGGEAVNFLDSAVPSKAHGRFQINVWAYSRNEASTLARQAEAALRAAPLHTTVLGSLVGTHEPETKIYGTRQDFSFWFAT